MSACGAGSVVGKLAQIHAERSYILKLVYTSGAKRLPFDEGIGLTDGGNSALNFFSCAILRASLPNWVRVTKMGASGPWLIEYIQNMRTSFHKRTNGQNSPRGWLYSLLAY